MDRGRSEPSTAPASPNESDDEEFEADVDYDDVSHSIPTLRVRVRSNDRFSQLWMCVVMTPPPLEADKVDHTTT